MGHICLLVWADDQLSRWSVGLLRVKEEWLNSARNRDLRATLKAGHRDKILWLCPHCRAARGARPEGQCSRREFHAAAENDAGRK
nr:NaeI family type II restriction endonuclease [Streptomyces niveus]